MIAVQQNVSTKHFVSFLGTELGETIENVVFQGSTRRVEECGKKAGPRNERSSSVVALKGSARGVEECEKRTVVGSNSLSKRPHPGARPHARRAGVLDLAFIPQAYRTFWE